MCPPVDLKKATPSNAVILGSWQLNWREIVIRFNCARSYFDGLHAHRVATCNGYDLILTVLTEFEFTYE